MPTLPRLKGNALHAVRRLLESRPLRAVARYQLRQSAGLSTLDALPTEAYEGFEESPEPVAGATPHQWTDAEYEPPAPSDGRQSARTLVEAYRSGELTPQEVFDRIADHIERGDFGESLNSPFVSLDLERAKRAADESTERYRQGRPAGPLDGVVMPIKDHLQMRGLQTGCGTSYVPERVEADTEDAEIVRRLDRGGALLVGKSRSTEWGLQPTGFNASQVMPRNPYDRQRAAGGSSTGTAAAIALGLAPVGHGSDGGGSIRIPSSLCGLFGLKPTYQRLSRVGDLWKGTMSHNGPIGQSTTDLVDFLAVAGGSPDPDDRATQWAPDPETFIERMRAALGRGVDGCRIGIWKWAFESADEGIADSCTTALRALEREGAELVEVEPEYARHHRGLGSITVGVEGTARISQVIERYGERVGDDIRTMHAALSTISGTSYVLANNVRAVLRRTVAATFEEVDLIACPTTNAVAPKYPPEDDRVAIRQTTSVCLTSRPAAGPVRVSEQSVRHPGWLLARRTSRRATGRPATDRRRLGRAQRHRRDGAPGAAWVDGLAAPGQP
ncbi:MAG: amidase [Bradymonadaceae bacterium]